MTLNARKSPDYLKNAVIYQLFLRPFTPDGTLKSAMKMIPHLAELGIDILYLCPITEADDDMRQEFWSDRQKKCGLGNPKNPYRVKDYYRVDPEYGTEKDLKDFIRCAHEFGIRVILDLVYYHCGPNFVMLQEHPDFVKRSSSDGSVLNGLWRFPELNFNSSDLREYLFRNMEFFIREFDADGYRCDVADMVPIDFWEDGRRRIEAIKPDVIMLSEGTSADGQAYAFDLNYSFGWEALYNVFAGNAPASEMKRIWTSYRQKLLPGARFIRATENHDIVNDRARPDAVLGWKAHNAMLAFNFGLDGVPFLYNGQEIADCTTHSIWGNRFYGKNLMIDWSNALTPQGKMRFKFLQTLISFRHTKNIFSEGSVSWLENNNPDALITFSRNLPEKNLIVVINCRNISVHAEIQVSGHRISKPEILLNHGTDCSLENNVL